MSKRFLRIKQAIKEQGYTYESLGDAVGLSKTSIARIAAGDQTPSFDTLKMISDTLNVDIKDLFVSTKDGQSMKPIFQKDDEGKLVEIGYLYPNINTKKTK